MPTHHGRRVGLLLLAPTGTGLSLVGNAQLSVLSGGVAVVNSSDAEATRLTGNAVARADELFHFGGVTLKGKNARIDATLTRLVAPVPDPLAHLPEPDPRALSLQSAQSLHITGSQVLWPGVYRGGIRVSGQGQVTLKPGIYYLAGGGLQVTGQGSVSGDGVLLFNDGADRVAIEGKGYVSLSPARSGPWAEILVFQRRTSPAAFTVKGNGTVRLQGVWYGAQATADLGGNGSEALAGTAFICGNAVIGGNGEIAVDVSQ